MTTSECPFCGFPPDRIVLANDHSFAIYDGFPVSPGHMLVLPKRHIASIFEGSEEEKAAMLALLSEVRELIQKEFNPDGFNVGINDGPAAGQTVMHLHIHLIPRYKGDKAYPRGGVRWIFPEKAIYWENS